MTLEVVYAGGTWDLFHVGHLAFLQDARDLGDVLIVGVMPDKAVAYYKGHPPVIGYAERSRIVGALNMVDMVLEHYVIDRKTTYAEWYVGRQPHQSPRFTLPCSPTLPQYIKWYGITLLVHGDDCAPQEYLGLGVPLRQIPYSPLETTTRIIERIRGQ